MEQATNLLDAEVIRHLSDYQAIGGGRGLEAAQKLGRAATVEEIEASGLRGRGGAGFPTGRKWRTVAQGEEGASLPATVVVNASEGEPGSFKDRFLLRQNPFRVLEGALIAAGSVGADTVVLAVKASFKPEIERLRAAVREVKKAGWAQGVGIDLVEGPSEYLFGEETALLEVIDGREPFPRITPPFRRGVEDIGPDPVSAAGAEMVAPGSPVPPTLVNNAETLANVPLILALGAGWFRERGTTDSPGTVLCTVSGCTRRHGVAEFPMGTLLSEVIERVGGGPVPGARITAVLSGVANPFLPAHLLDTPVSFENMEAAGTGLGAAGFIVFDDSVDLVAAAQAVSRFLAVESCGQCTPCKQDGLAISDLLDQLRQGKAGDAELEELAERTQTVADEARCYLATQHQRVVGSLLRLFPDLVTAHHRDNTVFIGEPVVIAPIAGLDGDRFVLDPQQGEKQPDWSNDAEYSGQSPADRVNQRATV